MDNYEQTEAFVPGRPATDKIAEALAKAQGEFPQVAKDKTAKVQMKAEKGGGSYSYTYADLASIIDAVRPALSKNGIAHTSRVEVGQRGTLLVTRLLHSSGQFLETEYPLPNPVQMRPQDFGSAMTYARRYSMTALLGIAPDDDDDGQQAAQAFDQQGPRPQRQKAAAGQENRAAGERRAPPEEGGGGGDKTGSTAPKEASAATGKWTAEQVAARPTDFADYILNLANTQETLAGVDMLEKTNLPLLKHLTQVAPDVAAMLRGKVNTVRAMIDANTRRDGDGYPG